MLQPVNDTNHTQLTTRLGLSSSASASASPSRSSSLLLLLLLHVAAAAADVVAGNFCGSKLKHRSKFSVVFVWLAANMRPYRSSCSARTQRVQRATYSHCDIPSSYTNCRGKPVIPNLAPPLHYPYPLAAVPLLAVARCFHMLDARSYMKSDFFA